MSDDRTLGAVAILFALLLAGFGWGLVAPFAYEPVGPRVFPLLAALLIGVCGVVLTIKGGGRVEANATGVNRGIAIIAATLFIYAYLFQPLGFVVSTALMTVVVARVFGGTWVQSAVTGIVLAVGSFLLFDRVLDVVLPTGILAGLI